MHGAGDPDGTTTPLEINGSGMWEFDPKAGVTRLTELKANEEMGFQMRVDSAIRDFNRREK